MRAVLAGLLAGMGHDVTTFSDGAEALLEVPRGRFELVVSDVRMPRMDGISLCRALREQQGLASLPVLLVSAVDQEDEILVALEAGARDYLTKPFSPAQLRAKVLQCLSGAKGSPRVGSSSSREASPLPAGAEEEEPSTFPCKFGRYELLGVLGCGGYGVVYDARRRADGKRAALKLLRQDVARDRDTLARFFREVGVLSTLASPHVVNVMDSGYLRGRYFLAMELVEGRSAESILDEGGRPLDVDLVLRIGRDMCAAIEALDAQGLVHRDIKPANLVIDREGRTVLVDFGLAKTGGDVALTSPAELMGTPDYLAPEVIRGDAESSRSDLYALGVSLYELLTGTRPFVAKGDYELLERIAQGRSAPPVNLLRREVPVDVSRLVAKLMDPEPTRRLADPGDARLAFEQLIQQRSR